MLLLQRKNHPRSVPGRDAALESAARLWNEMSSTVGLQGLTLVLSLSVSALSAEKSITTMTSHWPVTD